MEEWNKMQNIEKKFRNNDIDFQEKAMDLGFCIDCEETVFEPDCGYHVCPYEHGAEAFCYCPYSESVCEIAEEEEEEEEE